MEAIEWRKCLLIAQLREYISPFISLQHIRQFLHSTPCLWGEAAKVCFKHPDSFENTAIPCPFHTFAFLMNYLTSKHEWREGFSYLWQFLKHGSVGDHWLAASRKKKKRKESLYNIHKHAVFKYAVIIAKIHFHLLKLKIQS